LNILFQKDIKELVFLEGQIKVGVQKRD